MKHLIEKDPSDIKAELAKSDSSITGLANELGMDRRDVSFVINHGAEVFEAISLKIKNKEKLNAARVRRKNKA